MIRIQLSVRIHSANATTALCSPFNKYNCLQGVHFCLFDCDGPQPSLIRLLLSYRQPSQQLKGSDELHFLHVSNEGQDHRTFLQLGRLQMTIQSTYSSQATQNYLGFKNELFVPKKKKFDALLRNLSSERQSKDLLEPSLSTPALYSQKT